MDNAILTLVTALCDAEAALSPEEQQATFPQFLGAVRALCGNTDAKTTGVAAHIKRAGVAAAAK